MEKKPETANTISDTKVDRYAIYEMIGKYIESDYSIEKIKGNVKSVYRDVFSHTIEIVIADHKYILREPDTIFKADDKIVFVYGGENYDTDDEFYDILKEASKQGLGVDSVFSLLERVYEKVTFFLSEPKIKRKNKKR